MSLDDCSGDSPWLIHSPGQLVMREKDSRHRNAQREGHKNNPPRPPHPKPGLHSAAHCILSRLPHGLHRQGLQVFRDQLKNAVYYKLTSCWHLLPRFRPPAACARTVSSSRFASGLSIRGTWPLPACWIAPATSRARTFCISTLSARLLWLTAAPIYTISKRKPRSRRNGSRPPQAFAICHFIRHRFPSFSRRSLACL